MASPTKARTETNSLLDAMAVSPWPALALLKGSGNTSELQEEKAALLALLRAAGVGSQTAWKLADLFDSARGVAGMDDGTLETVGALKPETIQSFRDALAAGFGYKQLEAARKLGVRVLLPGEGDYPPLLTRSFSPPALLYAWGQPLPTDGRAVAIVGSRKADEPSVELAHQIGAGLVKAGMATVSGMAYGIDAAAHRGSLQEGGPTVAVLGCGVDVVYPRQHRKLRDQIVRDGAVVSELFLGVGPEPKHFPMRNRIIAWMSAATVVVKAAQRSGALITAAYALQENREVFACPGHPLSPGFAGTNHLIKQGATLTRHAADVLEVIAPMVGLDLTTGQETLDLDAIPSGLDAEEQKVYTALDPVEKIHADRLATKLKLDTSRLGVLLLSMELKGVIKRLPGDHYIRSVSTQ